MKPVSKFRMYIMPLAVTLALGLVFFLTAGTFRFWQAWIYIAVFSSITLFMVVYFSKTNPGLLARRANYKEQETVRKIPSFLKLFLLMYLVPGLDFRFHWSSVPVWLVLAANGMVCAGYIFILFVFNENSYASSVIRLENEQKVITTGPYAVIRHPMYTGMVFMTLFTPLALGSFRAFLPCALFVPWLYLRIRNEEETLLSQLPGYREYSEKVRYRLFPMVW